MRVTCSPLVVEFVNGTTWRLALPFRVTLESSAYELPLQFSVPGGFSTDFASTPRIAWRLVPRVGPYGKAAVVHDWLYQVGKLPREQADRAFYDLMIGTGVPKFQAWLMWRAVRLFGGRYYHVAGA